MIKYETGNRLNFEDAQNYCQKLKDGSLVSIHNRWGQYRECKQHMFVYFISSWMVTIYHEIVSKDAAWSETTFFWLVTAQSLKIEPTEIQVSLHKKWKLRIWLHLLKKSLMENFIFCAVYIRKLGCHNKY